MKIYKDYSILFLHIEKTAGTSFSDFLKRNCDKKILFLYELPDDGNRKMKNAQIQFPESAAKKYEYICGHFSFGLHEKDFKNFYYYAFLRDPVDRLISEYYYGIENAHSYVLDKTTGKQRSLEEYIECASPNIQTMRVAGYDHSPPIKKSLKVAKTNIEKQFISVGITEYFNESVAILAKKLDFKSYFYRKKNYTTKRPGRSELSERIVRKIQERNRLDIELYSYAKKLFHRKMDGYGEDVKKLSDYIKILNGQYSWLIENFTSVINKPDSLNMRYFYHKQDLLKSEVGSKYRKIGIFGAGAAFDIELAEIKQYLAKADVVMVSDNDNTKWGSIRGGFKLVSPEELYEINPDLIIVTSAYRMSICHQLLGKKAELIASKKPVFDIVIGGGYRLRSDLSEYDDEIMSNDKWR